ncbi:MAG: SUMF1/EgtB/PvdO family nonheme iron enzyme [Candidatus Moduliflexus flocculans]|nr:SUMF1/EgtB/PvdO family nonheme iron enzyme [Candidatus Moduliflexus flocculans]
MPAGLENLPATGVTFERAKAYALWLSKLTGQAWRASDRGRGGPKLYEPSAAENTLDYWAGYAPNPDDVRRLAAKIEELGGPAALIKEVGRFSGSGKDGEELLYDLGGNAAEWVTAKDGGGKAVGGRRRPAGRSENRPGQTLRRVHGLPYRPDRDEEIIRIVTSDIEYIRGLTDNGPQENGQDPALVRQYRQPFPHGRRYFPGGRKARLLAGLDLSRFDRGLVGGNRPVPQEEPRARLRANPPRQGDEVVGQGLHPSVDPFLVRRDRRGQSRFRARALGPESRPDRLRRGRGRLRRRPGALRVGQGGQSVLLERCPHPDRPGPDGLPGGPYRFCRHPGYLGGVLFGMATPVVLGSYWALVPQAAAVLLLVGRTFLEDRMLKRDLLWYAEYTQAVRYRLIPGVW